MLDSCISCVVIWLRDIFQLTSNQDKLVSTKSTDFKCLIFKVLAVLHEYKLS